MNLFNHRWPSESLRRRLAGRIAPELRDECLNHASLVDQASDGIFLADLNTGRYKYVNAAGARMLGYTRAEILSKTIMDLIPPEELPKLAESKLIQLQGIVHVAEYRLKRKDGEYVPTEVSARILPDGRWQGFVRDVTERKRLEHALQRSIDELARATEREQRLRSELEQVTAASLTISEAVATVPNTEMSALLHTILLQAQALTGAQYAALGIGGSDEKPFDPWVYVGVADETARAIARHPRPVGTLGAVARRGQRIRQANIREHPEFRGMPPHHPDVRSFLGMPIFYRGAAVGNLFLGNKQGAPEFTDQDERMIAMLAARVGVAIETATLYRSEALRRLWLQTVINQMPEGVVLFDENGRMGSINSAMAKLSCGRTVHYDPFGNPIDFDMRRPDGTALKAEDSPAVLALQHGTITRSAEYQLSLEDGTLLPVLVNAAPVRGDNETIVGATLIVQEISKLKELERLREEWASIIAHDLRQPVTTIVVASELLALVHKGDLSEKEAKTIGRIRDASQRLNRMIDELLEASKIESHHLTISPHTEDLVRLIHDVVDVQRVAEKETPFVVEAPEKLSAYFDADRVRQVVDNLVSNAVKYGTLHAPVRIRVFDHADTAEVEVTNQGSGIAADEMPDLFERFWRSRRVRDERTPGLGLGLYIARGLIEAHGGRIWAESTPGETTSFHFTVPLEPTDARPQHQDIRSSPGENPP